MRLITAFACLSGLAIPSIAVAVTRADDGTGLPKFYHWNITDWHAGCARGCTYDFKVTGHKNGIYPSFLAYCSGHDSGFFEDCWLLESESTSGTPYVSSSLSPNVGDGIAAMAVSLSFTDTDTGVRITHNITGMHNTIYNAFVSPLDNFSIFTEDMTITQVA